MNVSRDGFDAVVRVPSWSLSEEDVAREGVLSVIGRVIR
jgi:hypothetical protein